MRLSTRLAKIERETKALRCDWCKHALRDMSPDEEAQLKAAPGKYVKVRCPWCATEVTYDVSRYSRRDLELFLIYKEYKFDGAMFRDERIYAAYMHARSSYELPRANAFAKVATLPPDELRRLL